jgi:DNA-binding NarL/FixJ family response regulator
MNVLVADDEKLARQRLVRLLGEIDGVTIVAECTNADEVLAAVKERDVDVALLDVEMPGLTGMEAFAMMGPRAPFVVFCTAHASYAVEAFDRGAADYVLKPVDPERLRVAIERARARMDKSAPQRLAIAGQSGVILVDPRVVSRKRRTARSSRSSRRPASAISRAILSTSSRKNFRTCSACTAARSSRSTTSPSSSRSRRVATSRASARTRSRSRGKPRAT